ncbi:hypothetical protein RI129_009632 [Pyrocoelia pectoralis]|uniref:RING-type domain-containing protein n=1 Tax=Pyrocoelia pectoralis TaxID=417401 RepID=A0AAN7V2H9_9COLE
MNPTEQLEQVQNELMCSICYDYFLRAFTLSCSHSFCYHCITAWRNNHHDCPICRSPIYSMAPSRALDNMVATFNGNQYRGDVNNEAIVVDDDNEENDPEDVFYDGSYASSSSSDIADGDDDYVADVSSVENDDRLSEDLNSQEDEYDPDIDYYDSETDANPASPDDSYLVDDVEDAVSSSPLHYSDVYESDDDSLYEYSYPSSLFLSLGMKSLQHW